MVRPKRQRKSLAWSLVTPAIRRVGNMRLPERHVQIRRPPNYRRRLGGLSCRIRYQCRQVSPNGPTPPETQAHQLFVAVAIAGHWRSGAASSANAIPVAKWGPPRLKETKYAAKGKGQSFRLILYWKRVRLAFGDP